MVASILSASCRHKLWVLHTAFYMAHADNSIDRVYDTTCTARYMAPEFASTPVPSYATDVFALGVTCYEMLKSGADHSKIPNKTSPW